MPIKGTFPKNVKKLIRTNSLYIEYTFFRPNLQKFGKKVEFFLILNKILPNSHQFWG